jgi:hypothetical protein
MEIPIRSVGERSALSEKPFVPGDRVWSYLYRAADGALERVDVLDAERDELNLEGGILCKWSQVIKARGVSEAEVRQAALKSTDDIFLSLYDEVGEEADDSPGARETRDRLKFFLALQLERKRVLKPLGRGRYRHMPSKRELMVPQLELTPELVTAHLKAEGLMAAEPEAIEREDEPTELSSSPDTYDAADPTGAPESLDSRE